MNIKEYLETREQIDSIREQLAQVCEKFSHESKIGVTLKGILMILNTVLWEK
jgi:hypothetical protein